jgi:pyrroline-5-carboxylate reductase
MKSTALNKKLQKPSVAIIGGGNLGTAIAQGLIESQFTTASKITITKRTPKSLDNLAALGCMISTDNSKAIANSDIVLLCVKPYQIKEVLENCKNAVKGNKIIISVITGVNILQLENMVPKKTILFRAMPNTAIAVKQSMTCISHKNALPEQIDIVNNLFLSVGQTVFIEDNLMDAATVLGACGTAYALRFIRAKMQGGIEIGFDNNTAKLIAAQTALGAAALLLQKNAHPESEIDKVTTPKGCTIAGLNEMEHQGFSSSLIKGILTSYQKIGH